MSSSLVTNLNAFIFVLTVLTWSALLTLVNYFGVESPCEPKSQRNSSCFVSVWNCGFLFQLSVWDNQHLITISCCLFHPFNPELCSDTDCLWSLFVSDFCTYGVGHWAHLSAEKHRETTEDAFIWRDSPRWQLINVFKLSIPSTFYMRCRDYGKGNG